MCEIQDEKNMAWVNTVGQYWTYQQKYMNLSYSMINHKNTIGYCKPTLSFQKSLNAGRRCLYNHQCNSMNCDNGICRGKPSGQNCARHEECDIQSACRRDVSQWPFETKCRSYAVTGDICDSDYDCDPLNFCSFDSASSKTSGIKKCLLKFSQNSGAQFGWQDFMNAATTAEAALLNGQYCKSGWAYQNGNIAVCFTFRSIQAKDGNNLSSPYACNPSTTISTFLDPLNSVNTCRYFFSDKSYVEDECSCSMEGGATGYCKWPGLNETQTYIAAMTQLWTATRCHTLDRMNMQAQAECGLGGSTKQTNQDLFSSIHDVYMQFNHWPLYQNKNGYKCWSGVYPNSLQGLKNYTSIITNQTNYKWRGSASYYSSYGFQNIKTIGIIICIIGIFQYLI